MLKHGQFAVVGLLVVSDEDGEQTRGLGGARAVAERVIRARWLRSILACLVDARLAVSHLVADRAGENVGGDEALRP
jgi:hypothetical protein